MSYELDVIAPLAPGQLSPAAVLSALPPQARDMAIAARGEGSRIVVDGAGFEITASARGAQLVSAPRGRGEADERVMEFAALVLAGTRGSVVDRHTGRPWSAALLGEWLPVAGLLSGRALAANEERIAHAVVPHAVLSLGERVATLAQHAARGGASTPFRTRLQEELQHYASRAAWALIMARGLATMGDFSRLEALTRTEGDPEAFAIAATYGVAALPLFERALEDADPNRRRAAARALHGVRDPRVLPFVARALEDRRSTVREAMLEGAFDEVLALTGARAMLDPMLERLVNDTSTLVRRSAARFRRGG